MKKISVIALLVMTILLCGCSKEDNDSYEEFFDLPDNYKYNIVNDGVDRSEDGEYTNVGYYKYEICRNDGKFKLTSSLGETLTMTEAFAADYALQSGLNSTEDLISSMEDQYDITFEDGVYTFVMSDKTKTNYAKLNENPYLWDEYLVDSDDPSKFHFATKRIYKDKENQVETVRKFMEKSVYNEETSRYEFDITKKDEIQGLEEYDIEYANIYITNGKLSKFEIKKTIESEGVIYTVNQTVTYEEYDEEITLPDDLIYCDHQYKDEVESITIYDHHFHGYVCTECGNIKDLTECEMQDGKCSVCGCEENE